MINAPTIYADNENQLANDVIVPNRRLTKWLAWFGCLLQPQQWLNNLVFNKYYSGLLSPMWVSGNTYAYGVDIMDVDYSVYECINVNGVTSATHPNQDSSNWIKILDTFVGAGERILYTEQKAMLEYLLNYYFQVGNVALPWVTSASPVTSGANKQIYISNNATYNGFWLTNTNLQNLTSYMANSSAYQKSFMRNVSVAIGYAFTINVPVAVDAAITANQVNGVTAQQIIRSIVSKYSQANFVFNYLTY